MHYTSWITHVGEAIDTVGVAIIVVGVIYGLVVVGIRGLARPEQRAGLYVRVRQQLGRAILLGLEVLVAGDIVRTVATTPTFTSLGVLAIIVAIRTFLSWSLELEMTGRWPWQKRASS